MAQLTWLIYMVTVYCTVMCFGNNWTCWIFLGLVSEFGLGSGLDRAIRQVGLDLNYISDRSLKRKGQLFSRFIFLHVFYLSIDVKLPFHSGRDFRLNRDRRCYRANYFNSVIQPVDLATLWSLETLFKKWSKGTTLLKWNLTWFTMYRGWRIPIWCQPTQADLIVGCIGRVYYKNQECCIAEQGIYLALKECILCQVVTHTGICGNMFHGFRF